MSRTSPEQKEFQTQSKDIYTVCNHNADRFFDEVGKTIPQYLQTMTDLQRAYIGAWKNVTESIISMQHEFATKSGANVNLPQAMARMINDASEEIINAHTMQNKAVMAVIGATHQSISTFDETTKSLTGLTHNAMENWFSICIPTRI